MNDLAFFTKWLVDFSGGGLGWETSYAHRWGQRLRTGDVMASRSEMGDTEKKRWVIISPTGVLVRYFWRLGNLESLLFGFFVVHCYFLF